MALSVVRAKTARAWTLTAVVALVAILIPQVPRWLPVANETDPAALRQRVIDSVDQPYQGYAEVNGSLQLPELPNLADLTSLLTSTTRVRTWYRDPSRWRFAVVSPVGERDTYSTPDAEYTWDYGTNQLTMLVGPAPVRVPRAGDLTPPELARRILTAAQGDPVTALPSQRIAGHDATGLRLVPRDPDTTIGHVDLWADPNTGLPLAVEVTARGATHPVLSTRFLDLDLTAPAADVLTPKRPVGSGYSIVPAPGIADALNSFGRGRPPSQLAGRDLRQTNAGGVRGVGVYGAGLSAFVVVPVPDYIGRRLADAISSAGGTTENPPRGEVTTLTIAPLSVAVASSSYTRRTFLLAGLTNTDVLLDAANELALLPWSRR